MVCKVLVYYIPVNVLSGHCVALVVANDALLCADETIGKKYAALLIQHIWRRRAARTRKVMEMFRGSEGVVRLKVSLPSGALLLLISFNSIF